MSYDLRSRSYEFGSFWCGAEPAAADDPGDGFLMRHLGVRFALALFRAHYEDLAVMEDLVRDSGLDWTISRPPRLTDKPLTGVYRTAYGQNLRGGVTVSRADVAHHMLSMINEPETIKQVVGIAN